MGVGLDDADAWVVGEGRAGMDVDAAAGVGSGVAVGVGLDNADAWVVGEGRAGMDVDAAAGVGSGVAVGADATAAPTGAVAPVGGGWLLPDPALQAPIPTARESARLIAIQSFSERRAVESIMLASIREFALKIFDRELHVSSDGSCCLGIQIDPAHIAGSVSSMNWSCLLLPRRPR